MSEMIERVARAMYARHFDVAKRPWESASEEYRLPYLRDAHVAIEAMREPTEGMVDAGRQGVWECETSAPKNVVWDWPGENAKAGWQAMIDEALK